MPLYNNLVKVPGTRNVTVGKRAGPKIGSGTDNLCYGESAGNTLTTGSANILIGRQSGSSMTTGGFSTCVGYQSALNLNNAGASITAVGANALGAYTGGSGNTAVGYAAGISRPTTGTNNTLLGDSTDLNTGTTNNATCLGFQATAFANGEFALAPRTDYMAIFGLSSTNAIRYRAWIQAEWVDNTDATRKARLVLSAWDGAQREGMRIEGTGTAAAIGFYGTAAVTQQTVTGSRGGNAALASLLTALATLGLIIDSST